MTADHRSAKPLRPSQVRTCILAEHAVLRQLYAHIDELVVRVLDEDPGAGSSLRERCRELYPTLLRHIELENAILAPALHDIDAFGPVRATELLLEHERQRETLLRALAALDADGARTLAEEVAQLIASLRTDMVHEERALLDENLLKDDSIDPSMATG